MTKKALLVAVGDYQGFATTLEAPEKDVLLWRKILENHGFGDFRQRINAEAKHDVVIDDLKWLLNGAMKDDQLVFMFLGHGRLVEAHAGASEPYEEALIVYPDGDRSLKSAEITDSDLTQLLMESRLAEGVDFAIGLDTCFAANLSVPVPPGAKPLFIPPAAELELSLASVRAFGSFGLASEFPMAKSILPDRGIERPLIIAACGKTEVAYELPIEGTPHMLFTLRATDYLAEAFAQQRHVTFEMLVKDIYPLEDGICQKPELTGNTGRRMERFPGEPGSLERLAGQKLAFATSEMAATATSPVLLNIDFEGIGCYAAARSTTDPYKKRLLFPYDSRIDPNRKHLTFIEIPQDHVESSNGILTPKKGPHFDDPTIYLRWELRGHVIRVMNTDNSQPFFPTALFDRHVPKMTQVYPPFQATQYHPRSECFRDNPGSDLLDAYFDLTAGTLRIGPLDDRETVFKPDSGPATLTILASRNTRLELPLTSEVATITVTPFTGGAPVATINVKRGGGVLIGNAREGDIMGDGTVEDPREHFNLYYNLANPRPADPPRPLRTLVPVNFCSQTHWP